MKHVEPLMNGGIINSVARLHLLCYYYSVEAHILFAINPGICAIYEIM
jgi:hypothetical protein